MRPSAKIDYDDREHHITVRVKRAGAGPRQERADGYALAAEVERLLAEYNDSESRVLTGLASIRCTWTGSTIPDWLATSCAIAIHRLGWEYA